MNPRKRNTIWVSAVVLLMLLAGITAAQIRLPVGGRVQGDGIATGVGLAGLGTGATPLTVDTTAVPTRWPATATLTCGSIAQSACKEQAMTLFGAVTGDELMLGPPATIDQGFQWSGYVSSANTVTVRMCKITGGTAAPAALSWRATIVKSF